ncbi:hypothetical protein BLA27_24265 [Brucella cytisi]|jgi:hypothetical protein|uniref:Uncharacterized protein n=1 Tax=Brucella cytisi TaxID=407152 RepID=A0A1J6HEL7_9HYPH|nr:hypothetical protein BLA27_24265 [Brucella cytisi]
MRIKTKSWSADLIRPDQNALKIPLTMSLGAASAIDFPFVAFKLWSMYLESGNRFRNKDMHNNECSN